MEINEAIKQVLKGDELEVAVASSSIKECKLAQIPIGIKLAEKCGSAC